MRILRSTLVPTYLVPTCRVIAPAIVPGAIALSLISCSAQPTDSPTSNSDDKLQIVTTVLPITYFTQAVVGTETDTARADVTQLLPRTVTPHDYQAKPLDVQAIAAADVLVQNGLELETFLSDLIDNADNDDLETIVASEGIPTLAIDESDSESHKEHGHKEHGHEEHSDEAETKGSEDHSAGAHDHGEFDPHVWLDPKQAIAQVENIRDGLVAADPNGEETYSANAAAYIDKLEALDSEITATLAPYKGQTFVTYHDFAAHFARSYGLEVEHLVTDTGSSAAPDDMQRVIETAKASNLNTLLSEPQAAGSPFEAIAGDLNIQVGTFDPMETSSQPPQPEHYITTMEANLENIEAALAKTVQ